MKLLIVDDHPVNLKLLRAQLELDDHVVLEASNGVEALRVMARERVDGVISDILMPEMDGFRLCMEVRKSRDFAELPFVFYTATYNSPQDRALAHSVGGDSYLLKPSPADVIVDAIRAAAAKLRPTRKEGAIRFGEPDVLKRYSAALVDKLEQKNAELEEALRHLQRAEERYRAVFENAAVGIAHGDLEGGFLMVNPKCCEIVGCAQEEILARNVRSFTHADDIARVESLRERLLAGASSAHEPEVRFVRDDLSIAWVDIATSLVRDEQGEALHFISVLHDITGRKKQETRIARLSRVKAIYSSVNAAIVRIRERGALLGAACRIAVEDGGLLAAWVGWHDREARMVKPVASAGHFDGLLDLLAGPIDPVEGEESAISVRVLLGEDAVATQDMRSAPGVRFRKEALERGYRSAMHLPLTVGGRTEGVLVLYAKETGCFDEEEERLLKGLASDVSFALESLDKSERLDYLAYYDVLTGLPNRTLFRDRLAHSMQGRQGKAVLVAVVLIDIERFQRVNVTAGRDAGDELLRMVGERLRRANDTAARIGVNLYALKLRGARGVGEVNRIVEAIVAACFGEPFTLKEHELRVGCRVGIALHPMDGMDAEALLRNAETALHRGKRTGERLVFFAAEMNARVADALATENKLRRALERQEFVLHYQPKVRLADGRITGVEALIRWQDPVQGVVLPGRFVQILEETGLIVEVGRWALACALADVRGWLASGLDVPRVAVNVSAVQLQRKDFDGMVIDAVSGAGNAPERLELEITESLLMHDVDQSIRKLSVLRGMGIAMSMDDFGTGYSSLSYLARLPIDKVKIDRSFVMGIVDNAESLAIVSGIIALVHSLKLGVIAEGVETAEQAQRLSALGCDEAQGYYFSRPLPADGFAALLQARTALP